MRYSQMIIFLILVSSGCSVMHNSQKEALAEFSHMSISVADVPGDIYAKYYELNHQYKILNSAADFMDAPNVNDAIKNLELKEKDMAIDEAKIHAFDVQYEILKKFGSLLLAMTDKSHEDEFVKQKEEFATSFQLLRKKCNTLFPSINLQNSLGGLVAAVVQEIGTRSIQSLQRKYLNQLLKEAERPFIAICDFYIDQHSKEIDQLCKNLPEETVQAYSTYLYNIKSDSLLANNLLLYQDRLVPLYQSWQSKVKVILQLAKNQKESMQNLKEAYTALEKSLSTSATLKEMLPEISSLYNSYTNIRDAYACYAGEMKRIKETKTDSQPDK